MLLLDALLDSWDRQCRIVGNVASLINEGNRHFKASDDGMTIDQHLAHMHGTRRYFLSQIAPQHGEALAHAFADREGTPLADLEAIKECLATSSVAVRAAVEEALGQDGPMAGGHVVYDHPVLYMQHMVWHEGWHIGLIFLALRLNGQEPPEEWEEPQVWGQWRTETW